MALDLLKNASIAAGGVLPMCQDTGTAIVKGKKGQFVFTGGGDEAAIAHGIFDTYQTSNLRYSQMAPLDMYNEKNTGTNLPAEIKISSVDGDAYTFLFMAKGGGSANKSYLYQETKALLNEATLLPWIFDKMQASARRPARRTTSPSSSAARRPSSPSRRPSSPSTQYLDSLPTQGSAGGHGFRDVELEKAVLRARPDDRDRGPVRRQVLLPRRAGHPPPPPRRVVPGRHRRVVFGRPPGARQDHQGRHLPRTVGDRPGPVPARGHRGAPRPTPIDEDEAVHIDLTRPMDEILAELSNCPSPHG